MDVISSVGGGVVVSDQLLNFMCTFEFCKRPFLRMGHDSSGILSLIYGIN